MCFKLLIRFAEMFSISCICLSENSIPFLESKRTDDLLMQAQVVCRGDWDSVDLRTPLLALAQERVLSLIFLSVLDVYALLFL
jgi:hypothetical protein